MNQEQSGGQCADFEVRFCCPQFKTAECDGPQSTWTGWYNDEWGKKDEKIWVSNREEREELQMYGDGGACSTPTASEIRPRPTGSVSYQTTMWQYATNLVDHLSPEGYLCINEEQVNGFKVIFQSNFRYLEKVLFELVSSGPNLIKNPFTWADSPQIFMYPSYD